MAIVEESQTNEAGAGAPKVLDHEPGIYFGLPEDDYHADKALGSTDLRRLARDPANFWWSSKFNPDPDEEEKDEEAKVVGKALHASVLEGREALEARFAPRYKNGTTKEGKAEKASIIESGREPIKWKYWRRINVAGAIIRNHPFLGKAFENPIATELSIFWVCPRTGIKKKVRLDCLKPFSVVDYKSITNRDDVPFVELCRRHIGSYGYHTQAECYREGHGQMKTLLDEGRVFGLGKGDGKTLARLAKAADQPLEHFVFVFQQKTGAPLVWATQISTGNGIIDHARADIELAESNWAAYVERFGTDTPWLDAYDIEELDINDIPAWAFRRK